MTCASILFTEADSIKTYSSVSHLPLLSDSQSITLSHIMTHDIMINERKRKCFIKGIFFISILLFISFYLYIMFVNHNEWNTATPRLARFRLALTSVSTVELFATMARLARGQTSVSTVKIGAIWKNWCDRSYQRV